MKKFWKMLAVAVLSLATVFSFAACGGGFEAKLVEIKGLEVESYGIAVAKGQDAELLAEINEVIADWTREENGLTKIDQLVNHYTAVFNEEESTIPFTVHNNGKEDATEKIIMATESGFAPFEFIAENNQVVGVDVAIMGQVAYNMNKKLEILDVNFESLTEAIFARADVIAAGFTASAERKEAMDFSNYYFTSTQYIICDKDADIDGLEDLKGCAIGVQTGTTGDQLVEKEINSGVLKDSGATLKSFKNGPVAFEDLKKGSIKAIVLDKAPAAALVAKSAK